MTHEERVELICTTWNGVQPLRQVSAIPEGYQKNRCQIWRLTVIRARAFDRADLIRFDHRPGFGTYGSGSIRTKSFVHATEIGRRYVELCRAAARLSNLSWPEENYEGYATWQAEWKERRVAFRRALLGMTDGRLQEAQ